MRLFRRRLPRRIAIGLMAGAVLLPVEGPVQWFDGIETASSPDNRCWDYKDTERGFTAKMNDARGRGGRGGLSLDPELSKAARVHTREMVRRDLLHHTSEPAMRRRVTRWSTLGENVGVGGTVDSLHRAFMDSPPHRENIMYGTYRHVGVGVKRARGRMWVTVIFSAVEDPGTTLSMPRCY